jgi:hypothetical protein
MKKEARFKSQEFWQGMISLASGIVPLVAQVVELVKEFIARWKTKAPPPPLQVKEYCLTTDRVKKLVEDTFPGANTTRWDSRYYYTDLKTWQRIITEVLSTKPKYTSHKFDCENYALLTSSRVAARFKLNTCGVAIGDSPFGEHGYNVIIARVEGIARALVLEPQSGKFVGQGYSPRTVIFA